MVSDVLGEARKGHWTLLPTVALRHAGFPLDLVEVLAHPTASMRTVELRTAVRRVDEAGAELLHKLRGATELAVVGPRVGMRGTLPADVAHAAGYRRAQDQLVREWDRFEAEHGKRLDADRRRVAETFRDSAELREVLLLSNDAHHARFASWLDSLPERFGKNDRKTADLLARYLQRVASKNETTAHFGPIAAGRLGAGGAGVRWVDGGAPRRRVSCAYWAAEALAEAFSRRPGIRPRLTPRRRPLVFVSGGRATVYAPTTTTGFLSDWRFERVADELLSDQQLWLLERCDGLRAIEELDAAWPFGSDELGLEAVLSELVARDWIVDRLEIPVGTADPLVALRDRLPAPESSDDAREAHRQVASLAERLAEFATAQPAGRPAALAAAKREFTACTAVEPHRNQGRHYADRAIFYEECHSRVEELALGPDIGRLLAEELSPVYDLIMAGPRLRLRRERDILARWATRRFGVDRPVPLSVFYAAYFEDRAELDAACDSVDAELAALDDTITEALLAGADPGATEIEIPSGRLAELAPGHREDPAVVCNPDVLLAAGSASELAAGHFTAVLGECHAVRELLCHASYAPLLAERVPELARETHAAYRRMLAPDEVLCDLVRSHPNKTGVQLTFPIPDIEITGRSGKPREQVISPDQLRIVVRDGRVELRAEGAAGRLRPLSVPAGGQSIRQDPLAPLGFPRHYGGVSLTSRHRAHVPRLRSGRVVLRRESWRIPSGEFRGRRPLPGSGAADAADFHAVHELRARLRLPRHLFAKVPGEPKPLYLDLEAPLLVRQLCRAIRPNSDFVELSEMMPGPGQLWLDIEGRAHTSEFRYAVFSRPERR